MAPIFNQISNLYKAIKKVDKVVSTESGRVKPKNIKCDKPENVRRRKDKM